MNPSSFLATLPVVAALSLLTPLEAALAQVTILTVGPDGTYATIQSAIDAAGIGDDTEIRVESGTYLENLEVYAGFSAGSLTLLGGWNETFSFRNSDPENTTIDGNDSGPVIALGLQDVSFLVDGFTLTRGLELQGGGVKIGPTGTGHVTVSNCHIVGNVASGPGLPAGGGLSAQLTGSQQLDVLGCLIANNGAINTGGGQVAGGGILIAAGGTARFSIQRCDVEGNSIASDGGQRRGGGLFLSVIESAHGEVVDTVVFGNQGLGSGADAQGTGTLLLVSGSASLNVVQSGWALNHVTAGVTGPQLYIATTDSSTVRVSDSGLAQGDAGGVYASSDISSTLNLVNLTVADHPAIGLDLKQFGTAISSLYNSIAFGNSTDVSTQGTVDTGANLIGVDPLFVNPSGLDYNLRLGSPAENAGDNSPPGGLGILDFYGNPRIKDGIVDIGFVEGISEIFTDGFESGDASAWSASVP